MSQSDKAALYARLKEAGVSFDRHYREYSTEELADAVARLDSAEAAAAEEAVAEQRSEHGDIPMSDEDAARIFGTPRPAAMPEKTPVSVPRAEKDPAEMPGQRLNTAVELQPIRTDEQGRVWYQEEVRKPAFPKPRGRRVLQYMEGGVEEKTVKNGDYVETFEVAGTANRRPAEVKITLPSYQVGIYKDPRFPFKVHTYAEKQGFDLFEVQNYYGGAELVPTEIKRIYVENVLCYDVRTTVRAIQTEYRQLQLAGKVK